MVISDLLRRFMVESPVTVMARAVLEHAFPDQVLDQMFRRTAEQQCEDQLLFSTVVKVLASVVTRGRKSVRDSYLAETRAQAEATLSALYAKLQNTETVVVSGLVRESFVRLSPVMRGLKAVRPPLFPGYCTKILDGAHLTGTQHRLAETRTLHSSPLPGQALVTASCGACGSPPADAASLSGEPHPESWCSSQETGADGPLSGPASPAKDGQTTLAPALKRPPFRCFAAWHTGPRASPPLGLASRLNTNLAPTSVPA